MPTCLTCHEKGVGAHWKDALHMVHNVTCVTCHDAHATENKFAGAAGQMELCGTCHKAQQSGMHGLQEMAAFNPACTTCHNPHDDRGPVAEMLDNRSEGCRSCHDLTRMAKSEKVSFGKCGVAWWWPTSRSRRVARSRRWRRAP